ncbi:prolyl oligopeptidase family serine peptidase [Pelomyxa schiedti]|nr:prolyl oligopeptidase family serine peptidase [Pelomyxa schiedti]
MASYETGMTDIRRSQPSCSATHDRLTVPAADDSLPLPFVLHLPRGSASATTGTRARSEEGSAPLLVFLHGGGEAGTDLYNILPNHSGGMGTPTRMAENGDPLVAGVFILTPQCPHSWGEHGSKVITLIDWVIAHYPVSPKRVYLTGISLGGYGTWKIGSEFHTRFAAIAPMCGGGKPEVANNLKRTPVYCAHGVNDEVIAISGSDTIIRKLKELGNTDIIYNRIEDAPCPHLTMFEGHDPWTQTYSNPAFWSWLLEKSL